MKLGHWPKCQTLHIYPLSTPGGKVKIDLIFPLQAAVSEIRLIFKIAIFGHETWSLAKVPEVACIVSFYPKGSKLRLFLLYGQQFPIFKIPVFGHETWPLAKVPEVPHIMYCYPRGSKLSLFSIQVQRFSRYTPIFKIAIHVFGYET